MTMRLLLASVFAGSLLAPANAQLSPPNEAGVTMGHVHYNVKDAEAHKKLWVEQFGAVPLQRDGLAGVKIPGTLIIFRQQEPTGSSVGTVLDHFGLKVPNLAEALDRWRAAGLEVEREFKGAEGFPNAYVLGPDGFKLELQEDTSLTAKAIGYHLHYTVADHEALRKWYVEMFSATPRMRGSHETADVPGMNLTIQTPRREIPTLGTKGRNIDHIGFEVKDLEAFCKKLEAKGVKFDVPYRKVERLGIALAFLTDPSGVYMELTEGLDKY